LQTETKYDYRYQGGELLLFKHAVNWKNYLRRHIQEYLLGDVLEVGAGIGSTTRCLCDGRQRRWVCLEPDQRLAEDFRRSLTSEPLPMTVEIINGTLTELNSDQKFDALLYIDVLEHIEKDAEELKRAAYFLKPQGVIIVLVPAHNWLFTHFDRTIGHYRRYCKRSLRAVAPNNLSEEKMDYLDSVGLFASLGNRLFLRRAMPNLRQISFWDSYLVRCSVWVDPLFRNAIGKSVLAVWRLT